MKLFWKMFCSMVLMTVLFCSFGGYFLIYRQYQESMEKEVDDIFEENDLLCHMLIRERKVNPMDEIEELSKELNISVGQRKLYFRISGADGSRLGGNGELPVEALPLVGKIGEGEQGWELLEQEDGKIYLHAAAAMKLGETTAFLENCRDVTSIYQERQDQFYDFYRMMGISVCAIGILAFFIVSMTLRSVRMLSEATRKIAQGELDKRVEIKSQDELGQLSADFNRMADSLEGTIEQLKEAALRQEEFIGSFAHEMKTPLTSIIGYADLLRSCELTGDKVRENANYIFKEGRRLENLSGKMMDLIVLSKEDFERKPVEVRYFLERLRNDILPIMEQNGIRFTVQCEDAVLWLEEDLMITVCLNLLDNARKAVGNDGAISLCGKKKGGEYFITVEDNGIGIPKEQMERVKEAFYMVDKSRARAMGGAGLGLSICDKIVRLHGGMLWIESETGKGTRCIICLKNSKNAGEDFACLEGGENL